jgi:hypothetical protein
LACATPLVLGVPPEFAGLNSQSKKRKIQSGWVFWVNKAKGLVEFLDRQGVVLLALQQSDSARDPTAVNIQGAA